MEEAKTSQTSEIIDEAFLMPIRRKLTSPKFKRIWMACCVIFVLGIGIWGILGRSWVMMVEALVFLVIFIVEYEMLCKRAVRKNLRRMIETTGAADVSYTVSFSEDGIEFENNSNGGHGIFRYEVINRKVDVDDNLILIPKSDQLIPVFKSTLPPSEQEELLAFLKEKPTGIHW